MAISEETLEILSEQAAEYIVGTVGSAGVRNAHLNIAEYAGLSRGGVLFIGEPLGDKPRFADSHLSAQDEPIDWKYQPELAVLTHSIRNRKLYRDRDGDNSAGSGHYVYDRSADGVWQGHFVPHGFFDDNAKLGVYDMRRATPISTLVQARFVLGLLNVFGEANRKQVAEAVASYTNPPFYR